jgi:hypothetical protein
MPRARAPRSPFLPMDYGHVRSPRDHRHLEIHLHYVRPSA